jgi:hypothetical protein
MLRATLTIIWQLRGNCAATVELLLAKHRIVTPVQSASRVKQTTDRRGLRQSVVKLHCGLGLFNVIRNPAVAQHLQRLRASPEKQPHTARKDDNSAAVVEQLLNVARLNARDVMSTCLCPIPPATATGVQLEVATCAQALDIHTTPRNVSDAW